MAIADVVYGNMAVVAVVVDGNFDVFVADAVVVVVDNCGVNVVDNIGIFADQDFIFVFGTFGGIVAYAVLVGDNLKAVVADTVEHYNSHGGGASYNKDVSDHYDSYYS